MKDNELKLKDNGNNIRHLILKPCYCVENWQNLQQTLAKFKSTYIHTYSF